ncbi:MAG TPA: nucleoside triphosphate pyrophosphatase [Terriglobia bacterium]|nr:nucleoside triphosphate pyrophosphatase [Terriglobia bacterium]
MNRRLILASQSPRRRELLGILGVPFDILPADIAEIPAAGETPEQFVVRVAREKGMAVALRVSNSVVLSADTIVTIDGLILGKPVDENDAVRMLRRLSNRQHAVYTAVCVIGQIGEENTSCLHEGLERTDVWFNPMTDTQILDCVRREEVLDKAGAYAIQGFASVYIARIEGNYSNVMGLPLPMVADLLQRAEFYF